MNVRLVIESSGRRKVLNLNKREAVLGRSHGNTVRIPSSDVSRQHCRLLQEDGLVTLEDLGSVNGTFLNGRRIRGSEVVRPGDNVEVGPVTFVVEYELTPDALHRLHRKDNDLDALAALADGNVLEALADGEVLELAPEEEDAPVLEPIEDDLPVLEPIEDDDSGAIAVQPIEDDSGPIKADVNFDGGAWQMPEGGELRDLLSHLEDVEEPPTRQPAPRKRK